MNADDSGAIISRPATVDDAHFVWSVNNHPTVRAQSLQTDDISWETHIQWFRAQLVRSDCGFLIGLEGDERVGVARFDVSDGEATISIAVSLEHRGRGVGSRLIQIVTDLALNRLDVQIAIAYTRATNVASQRTFLANQYLCAGSVVLSGTTMLRFEKRKDGIRL